jgi:RHS repeat-associated protein
VTTYYFLGDRVVAMRQSTTLTYVHQDHLTGTSVVSDTSGALVSSIKYYPFGECRNSQGNPGTDKLFTGQRLDGTGLYYYGARYYDATIGRFISADIIVQNPSNPQTLNRYSYCGNNPLKYIDPSGTRFEVGDEEYILQLLGSGLEITAGSDLEAEINEWASQRLAIEEAYDAIMNDPDIPQWIKDYMQILHDSDRVIHIDIGDFGGGAVGISAMGICMRYNGFLIQIGATKDYIGIDVRWMSNLAPILAHECYHIYEGNPGATIEEEFVAHAAQFFVEKGLKGSSDLEWIFGIPGGLGSDTFLTGFKTALVERTRNDVYKVMPLWQSQMNMGWLVKQDIALGLGLPGWIGYAGPILTVRGIPWR